MNTDIVVQFDTELIMTVTVQSDALAEDKTYSASKARVRTEAEVLTLGVRRRRPARRQVQADAALLPVFLRQRQREPHALHHRGYGGRGGGVRPGPGRLPEPQRQREEARGRGRRPRPGGRAAQRRVVNHVPGGLLRLLLLLQVLCHRVVVVECGCDRSCCGRGPGQVVPPAV